MLILFIHSFSQYLLRTFSGTDTILGVNNPTLRPISNVPKEIAKESTKSLFQIKNNLLLSIVQATSSVGGKIYIRIKSNSMTWPKATGNRDIFFQ